LLTSRLVRIIVCILNTYQAGTLILNMPRSKVERARKSVEKYFSEIKKTVFSKTELLNILASKPPAWGISALSSLRGFIEFLIKERLLKERKVNAKYMEYPRYVKPQYSPYELALSLRPRSYLTHYTAVFINGLTDQIPRNIYVNKEQGPKENVLPNLKQAKIDYAFRRPPRRTTNLASCDDYKIYLLNGMHTGDLGVISVEGEYGEILKVTNVERTLIDISVRPFYSGGVFEVLGAFVYAQEKAAVSVTKILNYLGRLKFVYPYHQVIGFYLERSNVYEEDLIKPFREMPKEFDFYLTHEIKEKEYSENWRLYYPRGF